MKLRFVMMIALLGTLASSPAFALDLHGARSAGMIGEKTDGYTTALTPTPDVQALVADVNAKRQQEYARISKEKGQPADVVGQVAAAQIITQLPPGSPYQAPDGSWKKR